MSALGQKQTFALHQAVSVLPPKADIRWRLGEASPRRSLWEGVRRYIVTTSEREGRSLAPTTGTSVVSLKRGQSGTNRIRPPMGKSRCYCVNRRALRQNKSSQCSNQRCGESAGGEIVVTGLSGFTGLAAVAGGGVAGCAGAACCGLTKVGSGRPCG
jgi:hypothetical protein